MKKKFSTRRICLLGVFAAITAILGIYATLRVGNQIKIPLKFITVFMTGAIFGPLSAGIVAAVGDILNALLVPVGPILPQITAVEFLYGIIFGACFYKARENKVYFLRATICCVIQALISLFLMSALLTEVGYFSSVGTAMAIRLPAVAVTFLLHLVVTMGGRRLIFRLKDYITKEDL